MTARSIVVTGLAVILLTANACSLAKGRANSSKNVAPSSVAAGKQLFESHCASCHGMNAAGGMKIGIATSADLRQRHLEPLYHNDTSLLERAILDGKDEEGKSLNPAMPRWRGQLSKEQVDSIIAYLKTLK
ncbi:MAG: c-type cytochrome [Firmicutes bacterium]|nr:c-type cytochrome [Bacillota bacterium]